jgi:hypothetical protein
VFKQIVAFYQSSVLLYARIHKLKKLPNNCPEKLKIVVGKPQRLVANENSAEGTIQGVKHKSADIPLHNDKGNREALFEGFRRLISIVRYTAFAAADFPYPDKYVHND